MDSLGSHPSLRRGVLMIGHTYYPWDPRLRREARALVDEGWEVEIFCLQDDGEIARENVDGVRVERLPVRRHRGKGRLTYLAEYAAFFALAARAVLAHPRGRPPAVVQVHTLPDPLVFAAAGLAARGSRVLLDLHEAMPEFFASKYGLAPGRRVLRWLQFAETASVRYADHVLTVTDAIREVLVSRGAPASKITVVMNATATEMACEHAPPPERWGTPDRPIRLLYHGLISDLYDLGVVLSAMALLAAHDGPAIELTVAGTGPRESSIRTRARELGVASRVHFLGQRGFSEMRQLLAAADAGIVPMKNDDYLDLAMPTKLLEAVASGLPVLATRRRAVNQLFPEECVSYFAADDARDLANRMRELAADPREAGTRAARARIRAELVSWDVMKALYLDTVARLAARGPRGGRSPAPRREA